MFVTIGAIAHSHLGYGLPENFEILDPLRVLLRHTEGHFQADLDHLLVIMIYI